MILLPNHKQNDLVCIDVPDSGRFMELAKISHDNRFSYGTSSLRNIQYDLGIERESGQPSSCG